MKRVMPSQVVQTIDQLFPHAAKGVGVVQLEAANHGPQLLGIVSLIKEIPPELLSFSAADYAELVLAVSAIKSHLTMWSATDGKQRMMPPVNGRDAVDRNPKGACRLPRRVSSPLNHHTFVYHR